MSNIFWNASTVLVLASLSLAVALVSLSRRVASLQRQLDDREEQLAEALQEQEERLHAFVTSSMGMGQRLAQVERRLVATVERQDELAARDLSDVSYSQAARLVHRGADIDDIVKTCGISRSEAQLLALLKKSQPKAVND